MSSMAAARFWRSAFWRAHDLKRQLHILGHAAPVVERRRLEDHAIIAIEAGLARRLAIDPQLAGPRLG